MSLENGKRSRQQNPPTIQQVQDQIRSTCDDIIHFCTQQTGITFYHAEQALRINISSLGRVDELFDDDPCCHEMNKSQKGLAQFLIPRGNTSELFEVVEEPFDLLA